MEYWKFIQRCFIFKNSSARHNYHPHTNRNTCS